MGVVKEAAVGQDLAPHGDPDRYRLVPAYLTFLFVSEESSGVPQTVAKTLSEIRRSPTHRRSPAGDGPGNFNTVDDVNPSLP